MKKILGFFEFFVSLVIWTYVILKLFVFDVDVKLMQHINPGFTWILDYKFIFILLFIVILWVSAGTQKFMLKLGKFLVFPVLLIFWQIPKFFYNKGLWFLLFGYFSRIISFFLNLRTSLILLTVFLTSCFFLFKYNNPYFIFSAIAGFILLLIYHFYDRILMFFSPLRVFSLDISKYIDKLQLNENEKGEEYLYKFLANKNIFIKQEEINENDANIPPLEFDDPKKLLRPVLFFTALTFFNAGLKKIRDTGIYRIFLCLKFVNTIVWITVLFALINFAIYKLLPFDYTITEPVRFFDFIFYSFNNLFFNSIGYITPSGLYSRMASMCAPFVGIIMLAIYAGLLFSIHGRKSKKDLEAIIEFSNNQVIVAKKIIVEQYGITVNEAMMQLEKAKSILFEILKNISDIPD